MKPLNLAGCHNIAVIEEVLDGQTQELVLAQLFLSGS